MRLGLLLSILVLCLVAPSFQYGILRAEEIWSNLDDNKVTIEDIQIERSNIFVDYIEDVSGNGITIEGSLFSNGAVTVPGNLTNTAGIQFFGPLYVNGTVLADDGTGPGNYSFTIENNTGNTFILGELRAQGGINLENGRFVMDAVTGDTTISQALLRPNGGIVIGENVFSADLNGTITTQSYAYFGGDVLFGTNSNSDRTIARIPADGKYGGSTYFQGQDAAFRGGDLYLEPGDVADTAIFPGNIFIGSSDNKELFFGRSALSNGLNGGDFIIGGQNSLNGDGGNLYIVAGQTNSNNGTGGDIVLAPGLSDGSGRVGKIIVGSTETGRAGEALIITRPILDSGDAGDTYLQGQNTLFGIGGNLYFQAGSVRSGLGAPGDLILSPGDTRDFAQSFVYWGQPILGDLRITRAKVAASGGRTALTGQNGAIGQGGNLYLTAGDADSVSGNLTVAYPGGDIYLLPGSSRTGQAGKIILGRDFNDLFVARPDVLAGDARSTVYQGQSGLQGAGGDLVVQAGQGHTSGGDLYLVGGDGAGQVNVFAGDSNFAKSPFALGGDLTFRAGNGAKELGGNIYINGGDYINNSTTPTKDTTTAGDIFFSAGTGVGATARNGDIIIGPAVSAFEVKSDALYFETNSFEIHGGDDANSIVTLQADPENIISWNGQMVIKRTQQVYYYDIDTLFENYYTEDPFPPFSSLTDVETAELFDLSYWLGLSLRSLLRALTNDGDCDGHGLIHLVDVNGNPITTCDDNGLPQTAPVLLNYFPVNIPYYPPDGGLDLPPDLPGLPQENELQ